MIGFLRSHDAWNDCLKIGPDEGSLNAFSGAEIGELPLVGFFSRIAGNRVLFYRWDGKLQLRIGDDAPIDLTNAEVHWNCKGKTATFVLKQADRVLVNKSYPVSPDILNIENDPTPFVEPDHFDLFLFVRNVLRDPPRANRIYRNDKNEAIGAQSDAHPVVILGLSLAGFGAATALRQRGHKVTLWELDNDIPLRAMFSVTDPLRNAKVPGAEIEAMLLERLRCDGVQCPRESVELLKWHEEEGWVELTVKALGREPTITAARSVILAPNGALTDSGPDGWKELIGYGTSQSVWSDGPFYAGKPACIQGCGAWAMDQAAMLKQWASHVSILCDREPPRLAHNALPPGIELRTGARVESLLRSNDRLDFISIRENGNISVLPCSALFLCPEPVMKWAVLGRAFAKGTSARLENVALAGVAGGIPFGSHMDLYKNGVETGNTLSAKLAGQSEDMRSAQ